MRLIGLGVLVFLAAMPCFAQAWPPLEHTVWKGITEDWETAPEWERIEVPVTDGYRRQTIDQLRRTVSPLSSYSADEDFHFVDFNADGITDVIFNGWCGTEGAPPLLFLLNTGDDFAVTFSGHGFLAALDAPASKALRFRVFYPSDTLSPSQFVEEFAGRLTADHRFDYVIERYVTESLTPPDLSSCFKQPLAFTVTQEQYTLRTAPVIDNESERWFEANVFSEPYIVGNRMATFGAGAKGEAFCSRVDETGRVWWLVAMDVDSAPLWTLPIITHTWNSDAAPHWLGWMSSRYLE